MLFYFTLGARTSKESFAQMTRAWVLSCLVAYLNHAHRMTRGALYIIKGTRLRAHMHA